MLQWIVVISIGAIAGYFAEEIFKSSRWFFGNVLIGVAGSCTGLWAFNKIMFPMEPGVVESLCSGTAGAIFTLELSAMVSKIKLYRFNYIKKFFLKNRRSYSKGKLISFNINSIKK